MSRRTAVPSRILLAAAVALAGTVALAAPAAAHSTIIDTSPAEGAEIDEAPETFSVTANENLADITGTGEGFALQIVFEPTGEVVTDGPLTIDGPMLSTPGVPLEGGPYVMQYQVVSADGHPVSGEIPFTVAGGDPAQAPTDETGTEPAPTEEEAVPISAPAGDQGAAAAWIGGGIVAALILIGGIVALVVRARR